MKEALFKNPITLWLRWLMQVIITAIRYRGKNITLEYLCEISQTRFSRYNTVRKYARLRDVDMGNYSYISRQSQVYHARIGHFVCIGPGVIIGPGEHPTNMVSMHPMFYSTLGQSNPVIVEENLFDEFPVTHIGNDVWIGARAILRTGVTIGTGAIVAAGAVVSENVEPYSIVGGVPAKHIRYRFNEDQVRMLLDSEWWNRDLKWLKANRHKFTDISLFTGMGQ